MGQRDFPFYFRKNVVVYIAKRPIHNDKLVLVQPTLPAFKPGDQGLLASKAFCEFLLCYSQGFSRLYQHPAELKLATTVYRPRHILPVRALLLWR